MKWVGKVLLNRPDPDTQPTCLKAATDLTAAQAPLEWPIIIVFSSTARLSFINGSQRDLREIVRNKNKKKTCNPCCTVDLNIFNFGYGSRILAHLGSGSKELLSILKKC